MTTIDKIKTRLTCVALAQHFGYDIKNEGDRCKSWREGSSNPESVKVGRERWYDYGSQESGDVIDMYQSITGKNKSQSVRDIAELIGLDQELTKATKKKHTYSNLMDRAQEHFTSEIPDEAIVYLQSRGLREETIEMFGLGWSKGIVGKLITDGFSKEEISETGITKTFDRITIPYQKDGEICSFQSRTMTEETPKYKKTYNCEYSEGAVFCANKEEESVTEHIVEGEIDAMILEQEGFSAIATGGGDMSLSCFKTIVKKCRGKEVVVIGDHDPGKNQGYKAAMSAAERLFMAGIDVYISMVPGQAVKEDVNSYYLKNETVAPILQDKELFYIHELNNREFNKKTATRFIKRCASVLGKPDMLCLQEAFIAQYEVKFTQIWIKATFRIAMAPPSEDEIVRHIESKHDILYNPTSGFFVFNEKFWERKSNEVIGGKIGEFLANHRTGRLISSSESVLRTSSVQEVEFNESPYLINLQNGTLDIRTRELRPHRKSDYLNGIAHYNYDPKATCPKWLEFVHDIQLGNEQNINAIGNMFGYCLEANSDLQKMFFLIGDGSNGKSVLLNVLEFLHGETNVSHISMAGLGNPHERVFLMGKRINLCMETERTAKDVEQHLKSLAAGETFRGSYKFKDFVEFKPRTTVIFSMNNPLITNDVSKGFTRRLSMIEFPMEYVPMKDYDKNNPLQRPMIPFYEQRLMNESPGILNWSLNFWDDLSKKGYMEESERNKELVDEIVQLSNTSLAFMNESEGMITNKELSRQSVYDHYRTWCDDNGSKAASSRKFWPDISKRYKVKNTKSNGVRFVRIESREK